MPASPATIVTALMLTAAVLAVPAIGQDRPAHPYFPLGVGHTWKYRMTVTMPDGQTMRGTGTIAMHEVVERDDRQYFKVLAVVEGIPGAQEQPRYVRRGEDGVHVRSETAAKESLMLPEDVSIGRTWVDASNGFDMTMTIEAVEAVTIGDKTYKDCLKVVGKGQVNENFPVTSATWFAPGVGEVKSSMTFNRSVLDSELIAHTGP